MFFGNVGQLKDRLRRIEVHGDLGIHPSSAASGPQTRALIFEMSAVADLDASATQTLLELVESYSHRGVAVRFVKLRDGCRVLFERAGISLLLCHRKIADALVDAGIDVETAIRHPAPHSASSPAE
jgi:MFS superfamily sulfate permease-like transporter